MQRSCEWCQERKSKEKFNFLTTSPTVPHNQFKWFCCSKACMLQVMARQALLYKHDFHSLCIERSKTCTLVN